MERFKIYETWMSEDKRKIQSIVYFSDDTMKPNVSPELTILIQRLYYNEEGVLVKKETPYKDQQENNIA